MSYDATQGLLSMAAANQGTIEGRVKLQKLAFLLQWLGYPPFANLVFSYHHFGPYSRDFSDILHLAVADQLLEERLEDFENGGKRYSYALTDRGRSLAWEEQHGFEIMDLLHSQHWRTLELGATILFLERDEGLEPSQAIDRAVELKPECRSFRASADQLVSRLRAYRGTAQSST